MKNTFYRPSAINATEFRDIVSKMRSDLSKLLSGNVSQNQAIKYVKKLIDDGKPLSKNPEMVFWGLDEPENMPSDARVNYFYTPTYIAVSIMANTLLNRPQEVMQLEGFNEALRKGLLASTGRDFLGQGFYSLEGLIDCLEIFATADIFLFVRTYPDICPHFTNKLKEAVIYLEKQLYEGKIERSLGEDYIKKASSVVQKANSMGRKTRIFVYGTLLRGNSNHKYLSYSKFLGEAILHGYALYNLNFFPGIKRSETDFVKGELFEVDAQTLGRLNQLEGEGSLYSIKSEAVEMDGSIITDVGVYVYIHDVSKYNYISPDAQPWRG